MAIKQEEYKDFSLDFHRKLLYKPLVALMELTFRCPLHCEYCYCDCYNKPEAKEKELSTIQIMKIMDKCKADGCIWFCFSGGEPMIREDFLELYTYARKKGFLVIIFTPLVLMNKDILETFREMPPFNIETSLNAATPQGFREITKTDFFKSQIAAIKKLLESGLPVKVKTVVTRQNVEELDRIKGMVEGLGLQFRFFTKITARVNGDTHPCTLRLTPEEAAKINKQYGSFEFKESVRPYYAKGINPDDIGEECETDKLFTCAVGEFSYTISPAGKMFICHLLRSINYDLLKKRNTVREGFYKLREKLHHMKFETDSKCKGCKLRFICGWCPGIAILEKRALEKDIGYFCQLSKATLKINKTKKKNI